MRTRLEPASDTTCHAILDIFVEFHLDGVYVAELEWMACNLHHRITFLDARLVEFRLGLHDHTLPNVGPQLKPVA